MTATAEPDDAATTQGSSLGLIIFKFAGQRHLTTDEALATS